MPESHGGGDNLNWRKARRSLNHGACVEVANRSGMVAMRDSKDPQGLVLRYPASSWRAFIDAAKRGG
jgi:Domain of unknown function (DUF397)